MIKKCTGCGIALQTTDKEGQGYTPNIKNEYCMRCFRLKNYGEKKEETVDEKKILSKVNKSMGIAFFLIDFFNINIETIEIFKKIAIPKVLVISKCDTLRKEMKFTKIKNWLKNVYDIDTDIYFISNKNNFKNINIFKIMELKHFKTAYIMGITNAGKSTFLNSLLKKINSNKEIVVSNKPNTTLDFIKFRFDEFIIFDTPGFSYKNLGDSLINSEVKPITYQIKGETNIIINDKISINFSEDNSVTFYIINKNIKKNYKIDENNKFEILLPKNSDFIIPGIGFMNVKKSTKIKTNIKCFEIRPNISGEDYE